VRGRGGALVCTGDHPDRSLCAAQEKEDGEEAQLLIICIRCYCFKNRVTHDGATFSQTKGETSIIGKVDAKSVCPSTVLATNVIESVQPSDYLRTVNERDCCCLFFYGLSRDLVSPLSFVSLLLQSSSSRTLLSL
jgi:hypothetical protein